MMKKTFFTLLFGLIAYYSFSQNCDCKQYYEWLKKTFEENDAGFVHTVQNKGKESYSFHNKYISEKVAVANDLKNCVEVLKQWLSFFRKFHIGLFATPKTVPSNIIPAEPIAFKGKSAKEINKLVQAINKKTVGSIEGIWKTGPYTILVTKEKEHYVGYILESTNENWNSGDVKFWVKQELNIGTYLMGDRSPEQIKKVSFLDDKYLVLDNVILEKIAPIVSLSPSLELHYKIKFAENPFIVRLNDETVFVKVPSFGLDQRLIIDSLLAGWKDEILKSKNLIIDVRNNGGGADKTYNKILPFIYTNPIHRNQIEFYSSSLNNKKWKDVLKIQGLPENEKTMFTDFVNRLENNKGGFEKIFKENVNVVTIDSASVNPKKVGLLINENTASAAEQFILDLQQSWKVKTFGRQTAGALDIANVATINSPDGQMMLVYSTSRYITVNKIVIDDIGILPDYYIDDEVAENEWISFVLERMK